MSTFDKLIISSAVAFLGILVFATMNTPSNRVPNRLSGADQPYSYKNISSANASTTRSTIVRGGPGVLGSITINTADGRAIGIYDANAATTSGATLIGVIKASTAEQTLNYDISVVNGITLDVPASYAGSMTVTYR